MHRVYGLLLGFDGVEKSVDRAVLCSRRKVVGSACSPVITGDVRTSVLWQDRLNGACAVRHTQRPSRCGAAPRSLRIPCSAGPWLRHVPPS